MTSSPQGIVGRFPGRTGLPREDLEFESRGRWRDSFVRHDAGLVLACRPPTPAGDEAHILVVRPVGSQGRQVSVDH